MPSARGTFTIQDANAFVKGIGEIEDQQAKRQAEQDNRDMYAAADIIDRRNKSKDPQEQRQLEIKLQGYSPLVRHRAIGASREKAKWNTEALQEDFKQKAMKALPVWNNAKAKLKTGNKDGAVEDFMKLQNEFNPDGRRYQATKESDGRYKISSFDIHGKEIGSQTLTIEQMQEQAAQIMSSPDNMFDKFLKGRQELRLSNLDRWHNPDIYKDSAGNEYFRVVQIDPTTQEVKEVWTNSQNQPLEPEQVKALGHLTKQEKVSAKDKSIIEKNKAEAEYAKGGKGKGVDQQKVRNTVLKERSKMVVNSLMPLDDTAIETTEEKKKRNTLALLVSEVLDKHTDKNGKTDYDAAIKEINKKRAAKAKKAAPEKANTTTGGPGLGDMSGKAPASMPF